jgi:hypothetical protein
MKNTCRGFLLVLVSTGLLSTLSAQERAGYVSAVRESHVERRVLISEPSSASTRRWKRAWIGSWVAFAAASILDMRSSAGKHEVNPLLRSADGGFNTQRAGILKGAIGGGFFLMQRRLLKKSDNPRLYKTFAITNYAAAGAYGAVAAHNFGVAKK